MPTNLRSLIARFRDLDDRVAALEHLLTALLTDDHDESYGPEEAAASQEAPGAPPVRVGSALLVSSPDGSVTLQRAAQEPT